MSIRCYLIGDGSLLVHCSKILLSYGHQVCGIITSNKAVIDWAEKNSIRHFNSNENYIPFLTEKPFDYLFSIVYLFKIPSEVLGLPQKFAINFHDALLPNYAGIHATSWAIMNHEKIHGVTWHIMTKNIDEGDILKQRTVEISESETAFSLNMKCFQAAIKSFTELLGELSNEKYQRIRQDINYRTYYAKYKRPSLGCFISWALSAEDIAALIRALDFGSHENNIGVAKLVVCDTYVIVSKLSVLSTKSEERAGTVLEISDKGIKISTTTVDILINELKDFTGKKINISDFIKQSNLYAGYRFRDISMDKALIEDAYKIATKSEKFWVTQLQSFNETNVLNLKNKPQAFHQVDHSEKKVSFTIGNFNNMNLTGFTDKGNFILSAFIIFLSQMTENNHIGIWYKNKSLQLKVQEVGAFFADYLPLAIDITNIYNFLGVDKKVKSVLEQYNTHKAYALDIVYRYPNINIKLPCPNSLSIVVEENDEEYISDEEVAIKLVISNNILDCKLIFSNTVISETYAAIFINEFINYLNKININLKIG